jgi:putative ABC transport system ATP-binding protein
VPLGGPARDRATELLREFGLGERAGSLPAELSGGEQARGAFALALLRGAPLIVADEPTAELDDQSAAGLLAAIRGHASAGVTFVIATHDPEVTGIADRVLRLERGRVVTGAPPATASPSPPPSGSGEIVLRAGGLAKSYRVGAHVIAAVRDASLELRHGEVAVLLGRSGSGKSTLLTLLGGWQRPDAGAVRWASQADPEAVAWSELGYLPQRFGLLPELTVRENVEQPARLAHVLDEKSDVVDSLLVRLGLDELAARTPQEISIGQQQRAALARALVLDPTVLLADEPTSHQDAGWRDRVWELLTEVAAAGTSCLIATHEEAAARLATRVLRMDEGRLG